MPLLVFVRHADKKYKNGKGKPMHDSPIKDNQEREIRNLTSTLKKYKPKTIISSPYRRTRDTSRIMAYFLQSNKYLIPIKCDNLLSEYLGWQRPRYTEAKLYRETREYIQPLLGIESLTQAKDRIVEFYKKVEKNEDSTLIVTHGILLNFLYHYLTGKNITFDNLKGFVINDDNISLL